MSETKKTAFKKPASKKAVKRAVKKKAVKKAPKKSTTKKSKVSTKTTKSTQVKKKIVKKSSSVQKKAVTKSEPKETKNEVNESVTLPSSAGPRLQEKAVAAHTLIDLLEKPMYRIAYVSAICFLLIGIFSLSLSFLDTKVNQVAQLCSTGDCLQDPLLPPGEADANPDGNISNGGTTTTDPTNTATTPNTLPAVLEHVDPIPVVLEREERISFRVNHTDNIDVFSVSLDTGRERGISESRLSEQNYQFTLLPQDFDPGRYRVRIELRNSLGLQIYRLETFEVPQTQEPVTQTTADSTNTTTSSTTSNSTQPVTTGTNETDSGVESDIEETASETSQTDESDIEEVVDTPQTTPIINSTTNNLDDEQEDEVRFEIDRVPGVWKERVLIEVSAKIELTQVQLYARARSSLNARFLGTMNRERDSWHYSVDSKNLPNGTYEVFATANSNSGWLTSESKVITVSNEIISQPAITEQETQVSTYTPSTTLRNFFEIDESNEEEIENDDKNEFAEKLIIDNKTDLNDLMKRYAVAKQAGDESLIKAVESEIKKKQEALLLELLKQNNTRDQASQIELALIKRIDDIKVRVESFESIRTSRLNETVSKDTDNDGISDFDELNVYGTDPENADTDGDGYNDGAEVVGGYNPTDSEPEEVVKYELPTEIVGVTRSDVLEVSDVKPVVTNEVDTEQRATFAEIRGKGLPNSFVTLYVFSSPVIVTVKTDSDGSFVYRFDKELEDGEHEVYVAFTDNRGSILAQSEPFQFVKRAEAFSPVSTEEDSQITTEPNVIESTSASQIRVVLSLSILVLGFFLLMLGINIRETSPKVKEAEIET